MLIRFVSLKADLNLVGLFDTELDAFNAYKVEKEIYVKELAQKYQNDIDERSYVALLNYKVDIND